MHIDIDLVNNFALFCFFASTHVKNQEQSPSAIGIPHETKNAPETKYSNFFILSPPYYFYKWKIKDY